MGLRYDYSRSGSYLVLKAAPGEAVAVPTSTQPHRRPIFLSGILGLIISLCGMIVTQAYFPANGNTEGTESAFAILTIPCVSIAMAIRAKQGGQLADWWRYEEM